MDRALVLVGGMLQVGYGRWDTGYGRWEIAAGLRVWGLLIDCYSCEFVSIRGSRLWRGLRADQEMVPSVVRRSWWLRTEVSMAREIPVVSWSRVNPVLFRVGGTWMKPPRTRFREAESSCIKP